MMGHFYILNLIAALLYLFVGYRLFRLSRRTRQRPEFLLALNYLLSGVSYVLYEAPGLSDSNAEWILLVARPLYTISIVPVLLFTRNVFRRSSGWATAFVWLDSLMLFAGVSLSMLGGDIEGVIISSVWFWLDWIGYTAPYVWIAVEASFAYSAAKKRARIGMCTPEIVHCFWLWGCFGAFAALSDLMLIPVFMEYELTQTWPRWGDFAAGGLETASTIAIWLAFFPPAFYRRWIQRSAGAGEGAREPRRNKPQG